ncbi:hypothetical protein PM082_002987 [Marasmius tenuissimus]|nr:hypothetical protein PM082_002987 [Marasmius tenuissimus]
MCLRTLLRPFITGIAWVTFDSTSGSSGKATPRIFVGVANKGSNSVFVTNDGGSTWSAVAGQNTTFLPHKGVLSPSEKTLYVSYSDGAGPYDGTLGAVYKYSIANSTWTDITPASGDDLYFGFGGVAIDLQKPGTIMVAALNSWYPDGQIFRSTNSGASWSPLWTWGNYPEVNKFYSYSDSLAPWLGPNYPITEAGVLQIGWMMEALVIDPFDSNHMLYGTGATVYGSRDLLKWDSAHNISLKSMADGIEETAILGLISPPSGPSLLSAVGDIVGFVHNNLDKAPSTGFSGVEWPTTADVDFAGNKPAMIVGIGTGNTAETGKNVVVSSDSGATWSVHNGAPDNVSNGKVALSADGTTILWSTGGNGVLVSQNNAAFTTVSSLGANAVIASDKKNNSVFYGALTNKFYVSTDGGKTFAAKGTLGSSNSPFKIVVHPSVSGDVWVSTDTGLFHSTNSGSTFTAIAGVSQAWAIGLGAPAKSGGYPAVFAAANIDSGVGYFRSDDAGVNWVKINDVAHGFGSVGANVLTADPRVYGRVYIGTNGRGIFYGDASGANPPPSTTATTATSQPPVTTTGTTTATSQPPTTTGTQSAWGQCGGIGWTGPTACVSGYSCVVSNPYYSQCVPA